jgi:hypothetical protein
MKPTDKELNIMFSKKVRKNLIQKKLKALEVNKTQIILTPICTYFNP